MWIISPFCFNLKFSAGSKAPPCSICCVQTALTQNLNLIYPKLNTPNSPIFICPKLTLIYLPKTQHTKLKSKHLRQDHMVHVLQGWLCIPNHLLIYCIMHIQAISTFSPIGSLSSNGLRMHVCMYSTGIVWNELICGYAILQVYSTHTHTFIPFEDREPMGLKVDIAHIQCSFLLYQIYSFRLLFTNQLRLVLNEACCFLYM